MRDNEMNFLANIHFQKFIFHFLLIFLELNATAHAQIIIFIGRYLRVHIMVA